MEGACGALEESQNDGQFLSEIKVVALCRVIYTVTNSSIASIPAEDMCCKQRKPFEGSISSINRVAKLRSTLAEFDKSTPVCISRYS